MNAPVVVGVDGSSSSLDAAQSAACEARWRGRDLQVVYAVPWLQTEMPRQPDGSGLSESAERVIAGAVGRARATAPEVTATPAIRSGRPASVLLELSRTAELLVVGSRGMGGFAGLLVGSTALQLAGHARCPLLVVRRGGTPSGGVLLGVDGSASGQAAVRFAFAEASLRGAHLTALHAWETWNEPLIRTSGRPSLRGEPTQLRDEEERVLAEALAGWRAQYPDVVVERRMVNALTRPALIEASGEAAVLVVGARGRGGFSGLLLGSVSQDALHHAQCSVVVVRGRP